jgi:hypothetical protein
MNFEKFLSQEKASIVDRWFQLVVGTYAPQTANLLLNEKDEFANPVGYAVRQGTQGLFQELLQGMDPAKVKPFLDRIIRIRAIQEFSPGQALSFIFLLKTAIQEAARKDNWKDLITAEDLLTFESKIDQLALLAFDVYTECRERLTEVRIMEFKNRTYRLLQRAGLLEEMPQWRGPGSTGENP